MDLVREVSQPYPDVLARLPESLQSEGFGVLTELDVQETLQKKLGAAFRPYRILGACNPRLAKQALETDLGVGVALPCNGVVHAGEDGRTVVRAVDPERNLTALDIPGLSPMAAEVKARLQRALARL
ncbi:MAG: DUF302 domain-containing protein [Deltaproteobacteria bacterium]|nr:DUF302 domain-containing protein [Deltaproteobacteria bacterium]